MTRTVLFAALALATVCAWSPSWPLVVALLVVVALSVALSILDHLATRDTRLDVEARRNANRAAVVMDELVLRLKDVESFVSVQRAQRAAAPNVNGKPPEAFMAALRR